jgi:hypothetical protein
MLFKWEEATDTSGACPLLSIGGTWVNLASNDYYYMCFSLPLDVLLFLLFPWIYRFHENFISLLKAQLIYGSRAASLKREPLSHFWCAYSLNKFKYIIKSQLAIQGKCFTRHRIVKRRRFSSYIFLIIRLKRVMSDLNRWLHSCLLWGPKDNYWVLAVKNER